MVLNGYISRIITNLADKDYVYNKKKQNKDILTKIIDSLADLR